jgi:2'-5' RNA ligase
VKLPRRRYFGVKFLTACGLRDPVRVNFIFKFGRGIINMRLFVAIEVDESIRKRIEEALSGIVSRDFDLKPVGPENFHFTVKFLGEVHEKDVPDIEKIISASVKEFTPFHISVEGIGYFGDPRHIRVVWAGVKEGHEQMKKLMKDVNESLEHVRHEDYAPSPHMTIARVKSGKNVNDLSHEIDKMSHVKFGEMNVKFVKLKSSELARQGPVYRDVKAFALGE